MRDHTKLHALELADRREWLAQTAFGIAALAAARFNPATLAAGASAPLELGSRLELFLDRYLIDQLTGARLQMHAPVKLPRPRHPLIGAYTTVIKDGDRYRAVFRDQNPTYKGKLFDGNPGEMTCYAESVDGHEWTQPKLGLVEINGRRDNNVILRASPFSTNFSPFLDSRPGVPADQR
ncbi:MAG: hypothetical protein FJ404_13535, partial [Verrucomicrobia bacterium]|nr:hypothetical protein [Verrucomicrobiota bacterium]